LSSNLTYINLAEYCQNIQYGYTKSSSKEKIGPKFLRITDIQKKPINWESVPYCEISKKDFIKYELKQGDIVIARTGASTGSNAIYRGTSQSVVFASYLIRIQLKSDLVPDFVYYYLQSKAYKQYIESVIGGSAQPNANAKQLTQVLIPYHEKKAQTKISEYLKIIDDKIEINLSINLVLKKLSDTLFKRWFVEFDFPDENGDPYRYSGGEMKYTELGEIPSKWTISDLSSLFEIKRDGIKPLSELYNHYSFPSFDSDKYPILEHGDNIKSNKYVVYDDTILLSKLNPRFYRIWLPHNNHKKKISSTEFIVFKPINDFSRYYGYLLLNSDRIKEDMISHTTGSTGSRQRVRPDDTLEFKISLPDKHTYQKFNEMVKPLFQFSQNIIEENITLSRIRDIILPRLMLGKICVPLESE
jgi:type I restriction enzyme, S subunit